MGITRLQICQYHLFDHGDGGIVSGLGYPEVFGEGFFGMVLA
ncbi:MULTISPECIES: hypothetical protein [unclassified Rothia (in: high G+C Gram-positive bacteria)]|nr:MULTISPECIES: hypothetical protein [unclassified Rothia (in: high G+C Gram-positive bacteria)]